jgi:hypothetical protein
VPFISALAIRPTLANDTTRVPQSHLLIVCCLQHEASYLALLSSYYSKDQKYCDAVLEYTFATKSLVLPETTRVSALLNRIRLLEDFRRVSRRWVAHRRSGCGVGGNRHPKDARTVVFITAQLAEVPWITPARMLIACYLAGATSASPDPFCADRFLQQTSGDPSLHTHALMSTHAPFQISLECQR